MGGRGRGRHAAAVIIVGSEIVEGTILDTNGHWLTQRLQERGIWPRMLLTISDDEALIAQVILVALQTMHYIVVCGGLGCTPDDVTRRAVARAFSLPLEVDDDHVARLERGTSWARGEVARTAASFPRGAHPVTGHQDGVRGFLLENVLVLPGNPVEMQAMFEAFVRDYPPPDEPICRATVTLHTSEDALCQSLQEFEVAFPDIELGSYANPVSRPTEVTLVLRSRDRHTLERARSWFSRPGT